MNARTFVLLSLVLMSALLVCNGSRALPSFAAPPALPHAAPCNVSGFISSDTTWSPASCDPYIVTGSVIVQSGVYAGGATLTENGAYRIVVYAEDYDGLEAQPLVLTLGTVYLPLVVR